MKTIKLIVAIVALAALALLAGCSGGSETENKGNAKVGLKVVFANISSTSSVHSAIQSLGADSIGVDIIPANPAIQLTNHYIDLTSSSALTTTITLPDPVAPATSEPYLFRISAWKSTGAGSKMIYCGQARVEIKAGDNIIDLMAYPLNGFDSVAGNYTATASDGTTVPLVIDNYGRGTGTSSSTGGFFGNVAVYLAPMQSGDFDVTVVDINSSTGMLDSYGFGILNAATGSGSGAVTSIESGTNPTWTVARDIPPEFTIDMLNGKTFTTNTGYSLTLNAGGSVSGTPSQNPQWSVVHGALVLAFPASGGSLAYTETYAPVSLNATASGISGSYTATWSDASGSTGSGTYTIY